MHTVQYNNEPRHFVVLETGLIRSPQVQLVLLRARSCSRPARPSRQLRNSAVANPESTISPTLPEVLVLELGLLDVLLQLVHISERISRYSSPLLDGRLRTHCTSRLPHTSTPPPSSSSNTRSQVGKPASKSSRRHSRGRPRPYPAEPCGRRRPLPRSAGRNPQWGFRC